MGVKKFRKTDNKWWKTIVRGSFTIMSRKHYIGDMFGKMKESENTDDKIIKITKELIRKREIEDHKKSN